MVSDLQLDEAIADHHDPEDHQDLDDDEALSGYLVVSSHHWSIRCWVIGCRLLEVEWLPDLNSCHPTPITGYLPFRLCLDVGRAAHACRLAQPQNLPTGIRRPTNVE